MYFCMSLSAPTHTTTPSVRFPALSMSSIWFAFFAALSRFDRDMPIDRMTSCCSAEAPVASVAPAFLIKKRLKRSKSESFPPAPASNSSHDN